MLRWLALLFLIHAQAEAPPVALDARLPAKTGVRSTADSRPARAEPNPFRADEVLRKLLGGAAPAASTDGEIPLDEPVRLPEMRVKGVIKVAGRERVAAMIEIQGVGTFTAHEGDRLAFSVEGTRPMTAAAPHRGKTGDASSATGAGAAAAANAARPIVPVVLRVDRVGPDGVVVVEVGTLGKFLVIR